MMDDIAKHLAASPAASHWAKAGIRSHHGVCLPLFSLKTRQSCGIGEFLDLLPLIDWCKEIGFDCIQLLPLNDTGDDASPYNALSSCALNPLFLSLSALPKGEAGLEGMRALNALERIDYPKVRASKMKWLREYFHEAFSSAKAQSGYQAFCEEHPWLDEYARFRACREHNGCSPWSVWSSAEAPEELVTFYTFLQYLSFMQFGQVKRYAEAKGILLMGDVPILLSMDSADVWAAPSLFDLSLQAGAPPDAYSSDGQAWGFPLFRWDEMGRQGYAWWKRRLKTAESLYHLYRIDHAVGFFRIWAIPQGHSAKEGRFLPPEEARWEPQGKKLLEMMLNASKLLPIAEDLGSIPPIVRSTLFKLGIPGTKVMRWERNWNGDGSFIPPAAYNPVSLTTVSTPDSEPLALWWQNAPDEAKLLARLKGWTYAPDLGSERRLELLRDAHQSSSLFHINLLQEYLALVPGLSQADPRRERINVPGIISSANWIWRCKPSIEEFSVNSSLLSAMRSFCQ